ncbi:hypothetical protein BDV25DRAFT_170825 [Aspergillus avenaceus]|uniref:Aminoglycoside phosphotransferase domain-containing protein n=1 Tax=Aspergillus avenaceus TaxID=36643 RepID=A0A5N6TG54_ASPAV|nr:hypothetical protein BDV25DRAFT_170825 [Aspergillus avenaceus]
MATSDLVYSVDKEIAGLFENSTETHSACDTFAKQRFDGNIVPVAVQGLCSYTVYAGLNAEFVVQFHLASLQLSMDLANLARSIYGHFVPQVTFLRQIGEIIESKDLFTSTSRAEFFALSWKSPQHVDQTSRPNLYCQRKEELDALRLSLPDRFHPFIRESLDLLPTILSLPMVLLQNDFGVFNIIVNEMSCNLAGVHFKSGWSRFDDYVVLEDIIWSTFSKEVGGLSSDVVRAIKAARIAGLLLSLGFTSRLANIPKPVPSIRVTRLTDLA